MQHQHGVTHAATDEKRLVSRLVQPVQNLESAFGKFGPGNVVVGAGDYFRLPAPRIRAVVQMKFHLAKEIAAV
jgi:hypothetical protein